MNTKITKKEKFEMLKEIVLGAEHEFKSELIEFIEKEQTALAKPRAKTATQKINDKLIESVYEALVRAAAPVAVGDLMKDKQLESEIVAAGQPYSSSKVTALLKKLVDGGSIVNEKDGRKSLYSVPVVNE